MKAKKIEINSEFQKALELLEETNKSIFITGRAGTGKSTLLDYFRNHTKKNIVVLAPTGVAALNVKGQTIHSFFNFKPDITLDKIKKIKNKKENIFKKLDAVIIDEISMVRADLLDCVDRSLRLNCGQPSKPFGGMQMIFIGDLYQLPPVVTSQEKDLFSSHYSGPYFFNANIFNEFRMEFIELEKIYRQKDEGFINILNAIRNNSVEDSHIEVLNKRVNKGMTKKNYAITLTTTNQKASEINNRELKKIREDIHLYTAHVDGDFSRNSYPTDEDLHLAIGAQVMMLNNDGLGRWVNGSLGKILDICYDDEKECDVVIVRLENGEEEEVYPYMWELFHFNYDDTTSKITTETAGTFMQYPMKLAWAITIHKSQGKTFDKVVIDFDRGTFAHGQAYVALSRCTSLDGITLKQPFKKNYVRMDYRIVRFITEYQYDISEENMSFDDKMNLIEDSIENGSCLEITYLKNNDEKSKRIIAPREVGEMTYLNKKFIGLGAYCMTRKEIRVFRVDRILEMRVVEDN